MTTESGLAAVPEREEYAQAPVRRESIKRLPFVLSVAVLALYGCFLGALVINSLHWRIVQDLPCMLYYGYLIDHLGFVPYRDFLDPNLPGAYFLYVAIGRISGYSDLGIRLIDLSLLAAISGIVYATLRRFGRRAAWAGVILFGLHYLGRGPNDSLQRELILVLPLSAAVLVAFSERMRLDVRGLAVGLLFGVCATIKPHAGLAFPLVLAYLLMERKEARSRVALIAIAGFAIPIAVVALYLWRNQALGPFLEMARHVWPLYGSLTYRPEASEWVPVTGVARVGHLVHGVLFTSGLEIWWITAVVGVLTAVRGKGATVAGNRQVTLLAALCLFAAIYPAFSGQFIGYHFIPLSYFLCLLGALCLTPLPTQVSVLRQLAPVVALLAVTIVGTRAPEELTQGVEAPKEGRVDEIAAFLKANLRPADRVQPLDWTGGALHAMLIARAEVATPFVADVYFYLRPSDPYVQDLRRRFIGQLEAAKPRFIIEVLHYKVNYPGEDTTRPYPELKALLNREYRVALWRGGKSYVIYEKR